MSTVLQAALTFKMHGLRAGLLAILWLLTMMQAPLKAEISTIYSFSEAHVHLQSLDSSSLESRSLVVFDVDRVLIEYEDAILHPHNNVRMRELFIKAAPDISMMELRKHLNTISYHARPRLIEREVQGLIKMLQDKNIPVIALTATQIGSIPHIGSIQDWRIERLKELGITFSFQDVPFHSFSELTGAGASPVFKSGILFSATYPKGSVLKAFLQHMNLKPQSVIFFDDLLPNVHSVHQEIGSMGVEKVLSFHYLGAEKLNENLDLALAEAQIRHLLEHNEWLSEQKCKLKINRQTD